MHSLFWTTRDLTATFPAFRQSMAPIVRIAQPNVDYIFVPLIVGIHNQH
jgi:hypothetical protein